MKRTLAALLAVLMTLMLWVEPARAADQPLEVSLKTPIEKITTRHIQELELSVKNSENALESSSTVEKPLHIHRIGCAEQRFPG